jgi:rod shape-determining protein MreD
VTPKVWGRVALVALVALLAQVGVLDQIVVLGAHPDVMVVLAGAAGAVGGPSRGAMIGFVLGLVADLVVPTTYGLSSLTFVLVGFAAGLVRSLPGDRDGRSVQVATCVAASAVGTLLYALLGALLGQSVSLGQQVVYATLVVTVGAVVLGVVASGVMRWALRGADRGEPAHPVPSGGSATR